MASFIDNFREAMGWGKADHTQHLSNISQEKRQENRNRYVDSANNNAAYNSDLTISDAKYRGDAQKAAKSYNTFSRDYAPARFKTQIINFSYDRPNNTQNGLDDPSAGTTREFGKVLIRTPRVDSSNAAFSGQAGRYHTQSSDASGGSLNASGDMGVYEAVLGDGTVLDASSFNDLVKNNNSHIRWELASDASENNNASDDEVMSIFSEYKKALAKNKKDNISNWSKNWRGWVNSQNR